MFLIRVEIQHMLLSNGEKRSQYSILRIDGDRINNREHKKISKDIQVESDFSFMRTM